jgi:hypothetical protein
LRYLAIILLCKTANKTTGGLFRHKGVNFTVLGCCFNKNPWKSGGFNLVDLHGCGLDIDVLAHLADALTNDGIETIFNVVVRSG